MFEKILEQVFKSDADIERELRALLEQIESFQEDHKPVVCEEVTAGLADLEKKFMR